MSDWLIVVAVVAAVVAGLLANRRWNPHDADGDADGDDEGLGLGDFVNPVTTLAVILLAFVMVESLSSYGRARDNIGQEARVVDLLGETAGRVQDPDFARELQGNYICYARAVRVHEWESMVDGERAPEVSTWTGRLGTTYRELRSAGGDEEFDRLLDLDAERSQARLARISEANPSIPAGLNALMFGSITVSLLGISFFVSRKGNRGVQVCLVAVLAGLLGGTLYMINDLDQPYSGLNRLEPTEIARIQQSLEGDFAAQFPAAEPPCDTDGVAD